MIREQTAVLCMGDAGALIYRGRVRKVGLTITSCNGKEQRTFYRFVEGQEGKHGRAPSLPDNPPRS